MLIIEIALGIVLAILILGNLDSIIKFAFLGVIGFFCLAVVGIVIYGLLQIQASVWAGFFPDFWDTWMNATANVEMAWVIYQRAGYSFKPWSCR